MIPQGDQHYAGSAAHPLARGAPRARTTGGSAQRSTTSRASATGGVETELRVGQLAGIPAIRIAIRCPHGASTRFLVRGSQPRADRAALEFVYADHIARTRCSCRTRVDAG